MSLDVAGRRRQQTTREEVRAWVLELEDGVDKMIRQQVDNLLTNGAVLKRHLRSKESEMVRLMNGETP